jgi:hypothetical protein
MTRSKYMKSEIVIRVPDYQEWQKNVKNRIYISVDAKINYNSKINDLIKADPYCYPMFIEILCRVEYATCEWRDSEKNVRDVLQEVSTLGGRRFDHLEKLRTIKECLLIDFEVIGRSLDVEPLIEKKPIKAVKAVQAKLPGIEAPEPKLSKNQIAKKITDDFYVEMERVQGVKPPNSAYPANLKAVQTLLGEYDEAVIRAAMNYFLYEDPFLSKKMSGFWVIKNNFAKFLKEKPQQAKELGAIQYKTNAQGLYTLDVERNIVPGRDLSLPFEKLDINQKSERMRARGFLSEMGFTLTPDFPNDPELNQYVIEFCEYRKPYQQIWARELQIAKERVNARKEA